MLKGIQRQMVEVRTDKSSLFEKAYFVLRDEALQSANSRNIVDEANKIISVALENAQEKGKRASKKGNVRRRLALFAVGFLCGLGLALTVVAIGSFGA